MAGRTVFQCMRCGACCRWEGYVYLATDEARGLADHLGLAERDFIDRYCRLTSGRRKLSLAEREDGSCVLLADQSRCLVHEVKPAQCRSFPGVWRVDDCEHLCQAIKMTESGPTT